MTYLGGTCVCSGQGRDATSSLLSRVGEAKNAVQVISDLLVQLREQVAIPVKGHVDGRVTHAPLDRLRMSALGDCQRDGRVAKVVKTKVRDSNARSGGLPVSLVEDGPADRIAALVGKDQSILSGL